MVVPKDTSTVKIPPDSASAVMALLAGVDFEDEMNDAGYSSQHDPVQSAVSQLTKAWTAPEFEKRHGAGLSRAPPSSKSPGPRRSRYILHVDGRGRLM